MIKPPSINRALTIAVLASAFSACQSSPFGLTPSQLQALRTEPIAPLTIDYKTMVKGGLHDTLKDPMRPVIEVSEPARDIRLLQPFNRASLPAPCRADV